MIVTASTNEDLAVRFDVPNMQPEQIEPRGWNVDAYLVVSNPSTAGNITHRIQRQGDRVICSGRRSYIAERLYSVAVDCTLEYVGP